MLINKIEHIVVKLVLGIMLILSITEAFKYLIYDLSVSKYANLAILLGMLVTVVMILINKLSIKNQRNVKLFAFAIIVGYQITLVLSLSGSSAWDFWTVILRGTGQTVTPSEYFSHYPNNVAIAALETVLFQLMGKPSTPHFIVILNMLNILLIDGGVWLLIKATKKTLGANVSKYLGWIAFFTIIISPFVAIFYTDLLGFFVSSLLIWLLTLKTTNYQSLIIGIVLAGAYLIKPSLVITGIALFIKLVLDWIKTKKSTLKPLVLVFLPMSLLIVLGNGMIKSTVDESKSYDAWHFISMGMSKYGGYYQQDVDKTWPIKSPTERTKIEKQIMYNRMQEFGIRGYVKFLANKQKWNTGDGLFGWGLEADQRFLIPMTRNNIITQKIRNIFLNYPTIRVWHGMASMTQLVWTIALIGVLASLFIKNSKLDLIHLTILGFMVYLLLFEGGRSRYVIQFLPFILVSGASGLSLLVINLKVKLSSLKK